MEIKKYIKNNKKVIYITLGILIFISILITYIVVINIKARQLDKYTEVTFVTPNQAIIFWKSETPTLGYIKYGDKKYIRKNIETQTSSQESEVHVVVIERIPPEGIYISKHLEDSNILIFPKIELIQYTDTNNE